MAKTIRMLTTAASPERILDAGKVYTLPDEVADQFLAPFEPQMHEVEVQDEKTGLTKKVLRRMPLPQWKFAELVSDPAEKAEAIRPAKPDPGDQEDSN